MSGYSKDAPCPFLINASCSIHAIRPISCRQFNVFNRKCDEGEDPYYTRRDDVLTPIQEYTDRAFYIMLPFYGITDETDKAHVIKNNLIHSQVRILQLLNWKELAVKMDASASENR
ncbi:MAG: YkgJ family cysteine cluster protein [Nitrospirae bacterium]|nr:YkgJ family cysteine cluster protein [Nitrospirota bacterium]